MADHVRKQIRAAIRAALLNNTAAADLVNYAGGAPTPLDDLPAILIYTLDEGNDIGGATMGLSRTYARELDALIEIQDSGDDVQDRLDAIAVQVEARMGVDRTFGGLVKDSFLLSSTASLGAEANEFIGTLGLLYRLEYRTAEGDPITAT